MSTRSATICRYYARGMCSFGDRCRFSHPNEHLNSSSSTSTNIDNSDEMSAPDGNWANAPVFIPKNYQKSDLNEPNGAAAILNNDASKTYAEILGGDREEGAAAAVAATTSTTLCPYEMGCPYGLYCTYLHGELCEMCNKYCLHPNDKEQCRRHKQECVHQHERDMELSFAVARSQNKTCGICFDTILEKQGRERRFGILPNCNHIFCLECIRKWRQAKQFDNKITRSCPECRISSDFVCPSAFWVDTKDEKEKLLTDYKSALNDKDCKYFNKGKGKCPFGNKCFYKHALPNGKKIDVGQPPKGRKVFPDVAIMDLISDISLYGFINSRELSSSWIEYIDFPDSDDSDSSDGIGMD